MIGMRRFIGYAEALGALYPRAQWVVRDNDYDQFEWMHDDIPKPTKQELDAKIAELEANEPLRVVRDVRNYLLQQSDWTQGADIRALRGPEWCAAWDQYRQALRNITETNVNPVVDPMGVITNVDWPAPPKTT
jgi:hypothetical protein